MDPAGFRERFNRMRAGDSSARDELWDALSLQFLAPLVGHLLEKGLGADVQTAVDDSLLSLMNCATFTYVSHSATFCWLRTTARRRVLRVLKERRKAQGRPADSAVPAVQARLAAEPAPGEIGQLPDRATPSAEQNSIDRETGQIIRDELETLPDGARTAARLFYFDGLSCDEIAAICECTAGTVKKQLYAAREKLRESLQRRLHIQPQPPPRSPNGGPTLDSCPGNGEPEAGLASVSAGEIVGCCNGATPASDQTTATPLPEAAVELDRAEFDASPAPMKSHPKPAKPGYPGG